MSTDLSTFSAHSLTESEQEQLSQNIDAMISRYKANRQEINRLVFESVSAMTVAEDYEHQLANKKGLRRLIGGITGSNKKLQDKINSSRATVQYASQLTLQRIAEQNLMSFDLITAVNNKLNASVLSIEGELNEVYSTLIRFFKQSRSDVVQLENRVAQLEQNVALLNWKNSIEFQMFDGVEYIDLDDTAKIVCLVRDFYDITRSNWKTSDLLLLKSAMSDIGLLPRGTTSLSAFVHDVSSSPALMQKLLGEQALLRMPEPYLVPLLGLKKQELLDTDEAFVLDTVEQTLTEAGLSSDRPQLEARLVRNYVAQEAQVDMDTLVGNYDLILELLFDLRQAAFSGVLSAPDVPADAPEEIPEEAKDTAAAEEAERQGKEITQNELIDKLRESADKKEYLAKADAAYDRSTRESHMEALKYYLLAGDVSKGYAYFRAGQIYESEWTPLESGSKEYIDKVEEMYQKASDMGNTDAQCCLARFYSRISDDHAEVNTPEFWKKVHKLYEKVALQGNTDAQETLELLEMERNTDTPTNDSNVLLKININL